MLRFPAGVATFTIAVAALTAPIIVAYAPIYARYVDDSFGDWFWAPELEGPRVELSVVMASSAARPGDADRLVPPHERLGGPLRTMERRVARHRPSSVTVAGQPAMALGNRRMPLKSRRPTHVGSSL